MRKGVSKGQAAIEYMMIISISMVILVPLMFIVNSYISGSRDEMKIRSMEDSIDSLGESAEMIYFQGYPAKMTMKFYVPERAKNATLDGNLIWIKLGTDSGYTDIVTTTQANMTGVLPTEPGSYMLEIMATEDGLVNVSY